MWDRISRAHHVITSTSPEIRRRRATTVDHCGEVPRVVNGSLTGSEHHRSRPLRSGGHWSSEARGRHRSAPPAPVTAILCRHEMRGTARIEPGARARLTPSPHHVTHLDATTTAAQAERHHAFAASSGDRRHRPSNFVPIRNATRKNADPNTMGMCRRAVPPLIHMPQRTPTPKGGPSGSPIAMGASPSLLGAACASQLRAPHLTSV